MNHRAKDFLTKMGNNTKGLTEDLQEILDSNNIHVILSRLSFILRKRKKSDEANVLEKSLKEITKLGN